MQLAIIRASLLGLATADALGVPVEFSSRESLRLNPVTNMRGYGTFNQAPGTWSDDSALAFCLADALCQGYQLRDIADQFVRWFYEAHWTAHQEVFDIGIATRQAISRLRDGVPPEQAGGAGEYDNGNGSLMRILPLLFHTHTMPLRDRYRHCAEVSAITHGHPRSVIACFLYLELARFLLDGQDPHTAYQSLCQEAPGWFQALALPESEQVHFQRILQSDLGSLDREAIRSSGYVIHTLEAALWCLLKRNSYAETVLMAVNLGEDTDTTAAVVGGLAGIHYGVEGIPADWLRQLARKEDIEALAQRLAQRQ